jgi:hypothetical protein
MNRVRLIFGVLEANGKKIKKIYDKTVVFAVFV